jgi:hypothetical protein
LRFRAHYHLYPHPKRTWNFDTTSGNAKYLVQILKKNCEELKERLDGMRTIIDDADNNYLFISDMLRELYLNCEKLYCGIQWDIGFITNVVEVVTVSI